MGHTSRGDYTSLSYCVELSPINNLNVSNVLALGQPVTIMECAPGLRSDPEVRLEHHTSDMNDC